MGGVLTRTATVMTPVTDGQTTILTGYYVGSWFPGYSIYMSFPAFDLPPGSVIDRGELTYDMTALGHPAAITIVVQNAVGAGTPTNQVAVQGPEDYTPLSAYVIWDSFAATNTAHSMYTTGDFYLKMWAEWNPAMRVFSSEMAVLHVYYTAPPAAPTVGTNTRHSDTQNAVTWTNNATTEAPYTTLTVERSQSGGTWTQIASVSRTATGYTDTTTSANHFYSYRVRATNAAGTAVSAASNVTFNTPAAPTGASATKTGAMTVAVAWQDNSRTESNFEVQRNVDGGTFAVAGTVGEGVTSFTDTSAPGGTLTYRVRAYRGDLTATSAPSNAVTTTTAPAAPTLTDAWGPYAPTGANLRISWQHNSLDGSLQSKADVLYNVGAGDTLHSVTGTAGHFDIPITGIPATQVVTARVRTYGLHAEPGPYSTPQSTTLADTPACHFTMPPIDGTVVVDLPIPVAWDYADEFPQAGWTLRLLDAIGATLRTWTGTTQTAVSITGAVLTDDSDFGLALEVRSGSGFIGVATRTFRTDFLTPTVPLVTAAFDPATLSVEVVATAGATGDLPPTDRLVLLRIDGHDGVTDSEVLADPLPEGSVLLDYVPRLDATVTYRVQAVASNGAFSCADAQVTTASNGAVAINFGPGGARLLTLQWDATLGRDLQDDSEAFVFAGRPAPVVFAGEHTRESLSVAGTLLDAGNRAALDALGAWRQTCTYRQPGGRRIHVKVQKIAEGLGQAPGASSASLDLLWVE